MVVDTLEVRVTADTKGYISGMKKVTTTAKQVGSNLSKFVTLPLVGVGAAILKATSDMENYQASFETMLGSTERATGLLTDLKNVAEKTPFRLGDLADASKTMLAFGISLEDVMPNLRQLGDIAQGDREKLNSLTLAFSQIQSTGRLMGQDLLQLINAGFNPLQVISEQTGKSMATLKDEMSKGAISAEMVSNAFRIATSEGGRFFGGMERASQTLSGQVSTLMDNIVDLGRSFGEELLPYAKDAVAWATDLVKGFKELDSDTKKMILTIAGIAAASGPTVKAIGSMSTALIAMQAVLAGPLGVVALVGLLVGGIVALQNKFKEDRLKRASELFGSIQEELELSGKTAREAAEGIAKVDDALTRLATLQGKITAEDVAQLAAAYGLSEKQIARIGIISKQLSREQKEQLDTLYGISEEEERQQEATRQKYLALLKSGGAYETEKEIAKETAKVVTDWAAEAEKARIEGEQKVAIAAIDSGKTQKQIAEDLAAFQEEKRIEKENADKEAAEKEIEIAENAAKEKKNLLKAWGRYVRETYASLTRIAQMSYGYQIDSLTYRYDKEIEAAEGNEERIEELERQKANEINKVAEKSFNARQATATAEALINGAVAATKAFAELGPIAGPIAAATIAGLTAVEVGVIKSQKYIPSAQFGGSYMVPPGNEGDGGVLRVNQGEKVSVEPVRGGGSKKYYLMIGDRQFDAYLEEKVNSFLNSGRATITRSGVVRA